MSDDVPHTDNRDPAELIEQSVAYALRRARNLDVIDHLAELETRVAGQTPLADHWHHSAITTPADLSPFTDEDLDDAVINECALLS
jgi:hypothetical protein